MTRLALVAAACAACAPTTPAPRTPAGSGDAIIQLVTNVADAEVVIDGKLAGTIPATRTGTIAVDIAIEAGHHQLEVRHDDYFSAYAAVDLVRGQKQPVELKLWQILP